MPQPKKLPSHLVATTNFDVFYEAWQSKVRTAVLSAGFRGDTAEDLIQDIFADLFKGGYLNKFDPDIAKFSTFIWGHVRVRVLDRRRELAIRASREETADLTDPAYDRAMTDPALAQTELEQALAVCFAELSRFSATKSKNFARLFADIVDLCADGEFSQTAVGKRRGMTRQAVNAQLADLRQLPPIVALRRTLSA